jgi:hypothetical protein
MSAFVVDKKHIDLIVCAAEYYGKQGYQGAKMQWWQTDENGDYAGWRYLSANEDEREEYYTLSQLGQILVNENVASVCGRYPDCDSDIGNLPGPIDAYYMGPYVYENPGRLLTPGEAFAAIDCLDYQSCEHDAWRKTEAHAFLEAFRKSVCDSIKADVWELST